MSQVLYVWLQANRSYMLFYLGHTFFLLSYFLLLFSFKPIVYKQVWEQLPYLFMASFVFFVLFFTVQLMRKYDFYKGLLQMHSEKPKFSQMLFPNVVHVEDKLTVQVCQSIWQVSQGEMEKIKQQQSEQLEMIYLWIHQMKTPLATLWLTMQAKQNLVASDVEEEVHALSEGFDQMLHVARIADFRADYQVELYHLQPLLRAAIHDKKKQFIKHQIFPEFKLPDDDIYILTDEKWIQFIFSQIIQNAIKYTSYINKNSKIRFTCNVERDQVQVKITDKGPGIPAHDLPRVFQPSFTGANGREYPQATGLGLYLVKQICDRLEHGVEIESMVGSGTTVILSFQRGNMELHR
ncbi:sensor histidine kinase [Hazenella sp. IB182357]|uniref:histidine kinase n=1 Tax=Polycladospora coralii TaxID=2771432 RepID=A0A926RSW7_9BACL|nr:sensor histidine kinase [Polycladospora coralii]MBD1370843.1 sensor histidine kinase [Polycladospora coralii]MBS7529782.1 sensor histidine kinase [Polycladospora coralii]